MAFEKDDSDKIYDKVIVPVLRSSGVKPVRVDRITHNEDIDDRIISEVEKCDFVIADLTYARPSVYFEAGYAQRKVPVIYTSRKDHLKPKADDEFGNFRIHFDLQMKNIIVWNNHRDQEFRKKLKQRITHILLPLQRAIHVQEWEKAEIEKFNSLPTVQKEQLIIQTCSRIAEKRGYKGFYTSPEVLAKKFPGSISIVQMMTLRSGWFGQEFARKSLYTILIHVAKIFNKDILEDLNRYMLTGPLWFLDINQSGHGKQITKVIDSVFIFSFQKVSTQRVMTTLPYLEHKNNIFSWTTRQQPMVTPLKKGALYSKRDKLRKDVSRYISIQVFDNLKSESSFKIEFKDALQRVGLSNN